MANELMGDFAFPAIPVGFVLGICPSLLPGHFGQDLFDHAYEGFVAGLGLAIIGAAMLWLAISIRTVRGEDVILARRPRVRAICGVIYAVASLATFYYANRVHEPSPYFISSSTLAIMAGLPVGMGFWLTRRED